MFLALKELKHAKLRYAMITFIIVLIAWLVFILSGLGNGLSTLSAATIKNLDANYVVYQSGAESKFSKSIIPESITQDALQNKNVQDATPFGASMAAISHQSVENKSDVAILGIKAGSFIEPKVIEGSPLDSTIANGVLANETLRDNGYQIGDEIDIVGSNLSLKIIGFVENETYNHLPSIFANIEQWRSYQFAAPGSDNGVENPINAVVLQAPDLDPAELDSQIAGIETATKSTAINKMPGYMEENGTIMMMLVFLIVISSFIIAIFFYVITIQKTQQFGVMKAIGASNRFITKSIVAQVFVISLVGIIIGIILTYLTALVFPEGMPFDLKMDLVVMYAIALLLLSLLGSLVSVRQIGKIDPLTALGRVE